MGSVEWHYVQAWQHCHVVVVLSMDDVPTFAAIEDIVLLQTDVYTLVCSLLVTECFSHHFHAFRITSMLFKHIKLTQQNTFFVNHPHSMTPMYWVRMLFPQIPLPCIFL